MTAILKYLNHGIFLSFGPVFMKFSANVIAYQILQLKPIHIQVRVFL